MGLKDSGRSWVEVGFWENPQILAKELGLSLAQLIHKALRDFLLLLDGPKADPIFQQSSTIS